MKLNITREIPVVRAIRLHHILHTPDPTLYPANWWKGDGYVWPNERANARVRRELIQLTARPLCRLALRAYLRFRLFQSAIKSATNTKNGEK